MCFTKSLAQMEQDYFATLTAYCIAWATDWPYLDPDMIAATCKWFICICISAAIQDIVSDLLSMVEDNE